VVSGFFVFFLLFFCGGGGGMLGPDDGVYGSFIVSTSSFYTAEASVALHKFFVDGYNVSRPHETIF
jgi:hypothetical protein